MLVFIIVMIMVVMVVIGQVTVLHASLLDLLRRDLLQIVGLSEQGHAVNESLGEVEVDGAELARRIVLRKGVVVVVEALADRAQTHEQILDRIDACIVGFPAPNMGYAVHQPGRVQSEHVAENCRHEVGVHEALVPQKHRHNRWQYKANKYGK